MDKGGKSEIKVRSILKKNRNPIFLYYHMSFCYRHLLLLAQKNRTNKLYINDDYDRKYIFTLHAS